MRQFIDIMKETVETPPIASPPVLMLVHPGSACGSANNLLGKYDARAGRDGLVLDLNAAKGHVIVVDGDLSDELPQYPMFSAAIDAALSRAKAGGFIAMRIFACDDQTPDWPSVVAKTVGKLDLPTDTVFEMTGCWATYGRVGCVNAAERAMSRLEFKTDRSDNAIYDPDDED